MDARCVPFVAQIDEKYKIGANPLWPDKRVWTDTASGFSWELNGPRKNCWASYMVAVFFSFFLLSSGVWTDHFGLV